MMRTMPAVHARDFVPRDADALARLMHASIREIGARDYSQAQVEAWSPAPVSADAFLQRVSDGRRVLVAIASENQPAGFIELRADGYIDCFYCHPRFAGTGVGALLYARLEAIAHNRRMQSLRVDASEAARRFFLPRGFIVIQRQELERNGVLIHNFRMEKSCSPA